LTSAGLLLVLFHVWLFARQVWLGELTDLTVLGRWLLAGALVWGLVALRRQGAHLILGRRAVGIWLLAALLHGPAAADRSRDLVLPALPDVVATLAQAALGAAAVAGLALLGGLRSRVRQSPSNGSARLDFRPARPGPLAPGTHLVFAPRPPPQIN
jgi:hypothetical protein